MRKNKRCPVQKLTPELQKRLNRSKDISLMLEMDIRMNKGSELSNRIWIPCILSYIHDDFKEIKKELNERGLLHAER
ncbi:hypothetical protein SIM90_000936 [Salmonella enterica]|uniref:hypothetical protein n=1 Tax=Salmonella enterica TaxID=28901 RepID=UPI0009AE4235|nr:hypothetical protein [Salmonella enterica]EBV8146729.1 hypothetical protein [Salmonella enterica subsp. enterica serovar Rubislaw]EAA5748713.1 hypothetical protein [Salmonella enterica]EAA9786105.1 hypothetical protein [Salmonella enterica]EAB2724275.1 hypothetical protein [Salmonella enterica]EAM8328211.1 hypothetical protein [Salmonella enterica]